MSGTMAQAANRPQQGNDIIADDYMVHSEFTTSLRGIEVNPGLSSSFPSLFYQSKRFDYYEFTKLQFVWRPTSAITATKGMAILAFDPNPNAREPADLGEIMAYEASVAESIYKPVRLNVPLHMLKGRRYVRHGAKKDHLSLFDPGMLILANQGVDSEDDNTTLGVVEVHYTVKFSGYHLSGSEALAPPQLLLCNLVANQQVTTAAGAERLILDDGTNYDMPRGLAASVDKDTGKITMPKGLFKITLQSGIGITTNATGGYVVLNLYKGSNGATPTAITSSLGGGIMIHDIDGTKAWESMTGTTYVECEQDDVLEIWATCNGAGGDVTFNVDLSRVFIEAIA